MKHFKKKALGRSALLAGMVLALVLPLSALGAEPEEPSYEEAVAACVSEAGYTVERQLTTADSGYAVVLRWRSPYEGVRDYELYCFREEWGRPVVTRPLLPSTALPFEGYAPTDRAPDVLELTGDGYLTYVYRFEEPLLDGAGQVLHEAGLYTYRVELYTGELTVSHREGTAQGEFWDVFSSDWFAPYVEVCVDAGLMKGVGDGRFFPEGTLSDIESAVLALRLHDLGRGGDGSFEKAPWDWGYASLSLPDGAVLGEGYLSDGTAWDWTRLGRGDSGHFGFRLDSEEEQEWGRGLDYQRVVLTLSGREYDGELHLNGTGFLYFALARDSDDEEYWNNYNAVYGLSYSPTPDQWWRDAWYYAEQNDLGDLLSWGDSRWALAYRMAAVTELPAVNEIAGLPDTGEPDILELYRAGVLTGSDEYGTFDGDLTLTRAEAAAICARILRPELRVSFSPKPLETYETYTLTYLRKDGVREGGPYRPWCSLDLLAPDCQTLLRLDGTEVPIPQGYELAAVGDGLVGLIDYDGYRFAVMDSEGNLQEVPLRSDVFEVPQHWDGETLNGYHSAGGAFYNEQEEQVTPAFDWVGFVNAEGAGFVGLDGNIYRIEFAR